MEHSPGNILLIHGGWRELLTNFLDMVLLQSLEVVVAANHNLLAFILSAVLCKSHDDEGLAVAWEESRGHTALLVFDQFKCTSHLERVTFVIDGISAFKFAKNFFYFFKFLVAAFHAKLLKLVSVEKLLFV